MLPEIDHDFKFKPTYDIQGNHRATIICYYLISWENDLLIVETRQVDEKYKSDAN